MMRLMAKAIYVHGTAPAEQERLARFGSITDASFIDFLELEGARSILEVGSGLGNLSRQVAALRPEARVCGVEQSPDQLAKCARDLPNLEFRQADAHALPFGDNQFDLAFCRYVLEHVAGPTQVLREMRRVLKPGGRVFVQENNILVSVLEPPCPRFESLWERFARLQATLGGDGLIGKKLLAHMQAAGFTGIRLSIEPEVHYSGTPHLSVWIENLIAIVRGAEGQFRERGLATPEEVRQATEELRDFIRREDASSFFYWNRATAVK